MATIGNQFADFLLAADAFSYPSPLPTGHVVERIGGARKGRRSHRFAQTLAVERWMIVGPLVIPSVFSIPLPFPPSGLTLGGPTGSPSRGGEHDGAPSTSFPLPSGPARFPRTVS